MRISSFYTGRVDLLFAVQSPSSPHSSLHLHTIMNIEKSSRSRLRFPQIVQTQCLPSPQLPLLFVTVRTNSTKEGDAIHLYSLTDNRIYKLPAPYLRFPSHCKSYSNGWMMLESGDGVDQLLVSLKDDNNNECIRLPMEQYPQQYIECVFFSTPDDPDGVFFVREENMDGELLPYSDRFFLYRRSEQVFHAHRWKGTVFSNTVFYKGKLYALNDDWSLSAVDPLLPDTTLKVEMKLKLTSNSIQLLAYFTLVLVESGGEMLMVRIMGDDGRGPTCDVFRADFIKMEWVTVENLGDTSLFLTRTSSVSICAGKNGNRIYYIPLDFERIQAFEGIYGLYVVFELGKDGLTISSIPDGSPLNLSSIQGRGQRVSGWAWVAPTPSLA